MSWSFKVPGAPPSVNHIYKPVTIRANSGQVIRRVMKEPSVERYQMAVTIIARTHRPKGWQPPPGGQIRLYYSFVLKRDIDCDNALKALNDAIAMALGVNDKVFLPCVRSKSVHKNNDPHVVVEVADDPA